MKNAIGSLWRLALLVLLCFVPSGLAQQVSLQLTDPPSNNILDYIYVGPYSATNTQTGAGVQVICDDFKDNSNYQAYTYTVNNFSDLGNTLWGQFLTSHNEASQITQLYEEAAWLALQMLGQSGTQQGYYSYAIWAIFAPTEVASWLTTYSTDGGTACNTIFGAGSWSNNTCSSGNGGIVGQAKGRLSSFYSGEFSNILILTPNSCTSPGTCKEQEFFEVVAEGGTAAMYVALALFSCFVAILFRSRRQNAGPRTL